MVGSMRAARHILSLESQPVDTERMLQQAEADARQIRDFVKKSVGVSTLKQEKSFLRKLMSARFSFLRDEGKMREGLKTVEEKLLNFSLNNKCGQNETRRAFQKLLRAYLRTRRLLKYAYMRNRCGKPRRGACYLRRESQARGPFFSG